MSYEHGSADDTVFWRYCAPEMLTRKVKLDDQNLSLATCGASLPNDIFRNEHIIVHVSIAGALDTLPPV